jgi:hypothetical protein
MVRQRAGRLVVHRETAAIILQLRARTPETVEKLLLDAIDNDLSLIPFLVLAFYAGVRPSGELQKILWSDIDLNAKKHHVTIRAAIAKKRRKR